MSDEMSQKLLLDAILKRNAAENASTPERPWDPNPGATPPPPEMPIPPPPPAPPPPDYLGTPGPEGMMEAPPGGPVNDPLVQAHNIQQRNEEIAQNPFGQKMRQMLQLIKLGGGK